MPDLSAADRFVWQEGDIVIIKDPKNKAEEEEELAVVVDKINRMGLSDGN